MARTTTPLSAADTAALDAVAGRQAMRRALEVEGLSAALEWALDHLETAPEPYAAAASARPVVNSGWLAARADEYAVQADEANLVFDDPFIPSWRGTPTRPSQRRWVDRRLLAGG